MGGGGRCFSPPKHCPPPPTPHHTTCTQAHERPTPTPPPPLTGPLIVPLPSRSPGLRLQPVTVWCASCCVMLQYMYLKLELETTAGAPPAGAMVTCSDRS